MSVSGGGRGGVTASGGEVTGGSGMAGGSAGITAGGNATTAGASAMGGAHPVTGGESGASTEAGSGGSGGSGDAAGGEGGRVTSPGDCLRGPGFDPDCSKLYADKPEAYACGTMGAAARVDESFAGNCESIDLILAGRYNLCCPLASP